MSIDVSKVKFIAVIQNYWGRGDTQAEALKNAIKESGRYVRDVKHYSIYLVPEDTQVTGMGSLSYPMDAFHPIEIRRVRKGKDVSPRIMED